MSEANPAILIRLVKNNERKSYRLAYSEAFSSWYYVSSFVEGRVEKLPSLEHAIARRILVDDEVAQLLQQGWSHVLDSVA